MTTRMMATSGIYLAATVNGDSVGGVGYLSPQTYHYWRGTSQVSEPYEAFVPHRFAAGATPGRGLATGRRATNGGDLSPDEQLE